VPQLLDECLGDKPETLVLDRSDAYYLLIIPIDRMGRSLVVATARLSTPTPDLARRVARLFAKEFAQRQQLEVGH
jgi:hypothetical protein